MYNICRPFILHNDFLPPAEGAHDDWAYISYGYYDGVSVGENLFDQGRVDLRSLWEYSVERSSAMSGQFLEQTIFGFRSDEDEQQEADFWADKSREQYPFLFLSLLQFKNRKEAMGVYGEKKELEKASKKMHDECRALEEAMTDERSGYRARTYLTLDNSDLILVLLSKRYLPGVGVIDGLHRKRGEESCLKWPLGYSFTVASLYRKVLNGEKELEEEILPVIYIHAIEKEPGSVDYIYNKLKEALGGSYLSRGMQSTLGCNDELIVLKDIPWSKLRPLYKDKSGILNHSNKDYQSCLIGLTTTIGAPHQIQTAAEIDPGSMERETLSSALRDSLKSLEMLQNKNCVRCHSLKKDLYQILNILQRFETTPFPDYVFRTLLLLLYRVNTILKSTETTRDTEVFLQDFYELLKGISLYAQNSIRSDRQFTQSLDYNIRIYHTPVKLNAFYNAYIYNLKEYLNALEIDPKSRHKYEFLACPGIADTMWVLELFAALSNKEKVYIVGIPENQMYDIRRMLVMLSHEVGHFVGKEIRDRLKREARMEKLFARAAARCYRIELLKRNYKIDDEIDEKRFWSGLEAELERHLGQYVENQKQSETIMEKFSIISLDNIEDCKDFIEEHGYYSGILKDLLQDGMAVILGEKSEELFSFLLEDIFDRTLKEDGWKAARNKREELQRAIYGINGRLLSMSPWNPTALTLPAVADEIVLYFKECFADMIAIMTLRLTLSEYLYSLIQSAADQEDKTIRETTGMVRAALVVYCMVSSRDGFESIWDDREIEEIESRAENGDETSKQIVYFKENVLDLLDLFCKEEDQEEVSLYDNEDFMNNYGEKGGHVLYDEVFLKEIATYLLECRIKFQKVNCSKDDPRREELGRMYRLLQENDIEKVILGMQRHIFEYQEAVTEEIAVLIEKEKGNG